MSSAPVVEDDDAFKFDYSCSFCYQRINLEYEDWCPEKAGCAICEKCQQTHGFITTIKHSDKNDYYIITNNERIFFHCRHKASKTLKELNDYYKYGTAKADLVIMFLIIIFIITLVLGFYIENK